MHAYLIEMLECPACHEKLFMFVGVIGYINQAS